MKQLQLLINLLLVIAICAQGQNSETKMAGFTKIPSGKIYVHTDNEQYFQGDTIWYKVYLTDSRSGKLIPQPENVYIQVLDAAGSPVLNSLLLSSGGQVAGRFVIPENFRPGNYLLQAYTNYSFNFSPGTAFYRQISISRISSNSTNGAEKPRTENMIAEVTFMPEGGLLLENVTNLVAFKAISRLGYGVNAKGTVKDEKGVVVTSFTTDYKGMGLFFLTPQPGKSYFATVEGFPAFRYPFKPQANGVKLQLVNHTAKEVILNIAGNNNTLEGKTFYLANMYRGEVLFYQVFSMERISKVMKIESSRLKPGINRLVLLDDKFTPLSERLLFSKTGGVKILSVQPEKQVFEGVGMVKINISEDSLNGDYSNLSVAVLPEQSLPDGGFSKDIVSNTFIDTELNGFAESSADLFVDSEISSEAKLRLLMLTHGYSSYFWNTAPAMSEGLRFKQEAGITLKGVAKNKTTGQLIKNGEITLAIRKDNEMAFLTQKTDSAGNFTFPGLLFSDTAFVYVQAKKETGGLNTEISLSPLFDKMPEPGIFTGLLREKVKHDAGFATLKYNLNTEAGKNKPATRITRKQKEEQSTDGHFRLYDSPDFVFDIAENDAISYDNIIDFMTGKVPGVDISGNEVKIRGTGTFGADAAPLFLIDGIPVVPNKSFDFPDGNLPEANELPVITDNEQTVKAVKAIPLSDIDKVEVLKSAQNMSVFGTKGSNGVIAIYTRRGELLNKKDPVRGIIESKIAGYSVYKDFYVPSFHPAETSNTGTLLYWNPQVTTKNGAAELKFPVTSLSGDCRVIVEGISKNGKICTGTAGFTIQ